MPLDAYIEAVLFWKAEPLSVKELAKILDKSQENIQAAISELGKKLEGRGLQLIIKDDEVMLGTHKDAGALIEKLIKEDLTKDLGKAGLETLSIILYRGPLARKDIDYIRGVNSNFIIRNLLIRGLIEKVQSTDDQRSFIYKPTFELLSYLGVGSLEELPEYSKVRDEIKAHQESLEEQEEHES